MNSITLVLQTTETEIYILVYNQKTIPNCQGCKLEQNTLGREYQTAS